MKTYLKISHIITVISVVFIVFVIKELYGLWFYVFILPTLNSIIATLIEIKNFINERRCK